MTTDPAWEEFLKIWRENVKRSVEEDRLARLRKEDEERKREAEEREALRIAREHTLEGAKEVGFREGRYSKALEVAQKLKIRNELSIEEIAEVTGLQEKEVKRVRI